VSSDETFTLTGRPVRSCQYGENKYQKSTVYTLGSSDPLAIPDSFQLLDGTEMSHNGWCDVDRLVDVFTLLTAGLSRSSCMTTGGRCTAIAVKHGNPCGVGTYFTSRQAIMSMVTGDLVSVTGAAVIVNFEMTADLANLLLHYEVPEGHRRLIDIVCAPSFTPEAIEILRRKKGRCRLLLNAALATVYDQRSLCTAQLVRPVRGGFLVQDPYSFVINLLGEENPERLIIYNGDAPAGRLRAETIESLVIAWAVAWRSNSNTISIVEGGRLIGNGCGRQDRVGAAKLAIWIAQQGAQGRLRESVAASDSFFPFPDGPQVLIDAGVRAILTTSGSVNDKQTIELCKERGVTLVMVPDTIGRGFYRH